MIVIDAHLDLAWNALNWGRDITLRVAQIRAGEANSKEAHRGANTVSLPEMRRGEVAVCLATVLARTSGLHEPLLDYPSREIASSMAQGQATYYRMLEHRGLLRAIESRGALDRHFDDWKAEQSPLGYVLSMEGADPILPPADLEWWWEQGLRVVGLAHYGRSGYACGTGTSGGLAPQGRDLLREMERMGMILDLTHLADEAFWQALDTFHGRVLASHNNCRSLVPGQRQFTDEQIRALVDRDAVIGVAFDSWMLHPNYEFGITPNSNVTLRDVIAHIDHICQLAGNCLHVGIGSDLDGGYGREQSPSDLDTIADLQKVPLLLGDRGYKLVDVEAVMHGNWLRFFRSAWRE
jgi:membrane dipeptidase